MRSSLKEPIDELFKSWEAMSAAADAHISGDVNAAARLFGEANDAALWDWLYPEWERCHLNVVEKKPPGDSVPISEDHRDPKRYLSDADKDRLIRRDGYRCRYCGIPVISRQIRAEAHRLYPSSVPWDAKDPRKCHMGFQALWLQFDHVVPHSHGGLSDEANSVVCCALCNFGKDKYTLRQLRLSDPRDGAPVPVTWDGLQRLMTRSIHKPIQDPLPKSRMLNASPEVLSKRSSMIRDFFLPEAWISAGYVFTPSMNGKERWFKISIDVEAELVSRGGIQGCKLRCAPSLLLRRGLTPEELEDSGDTAETSAS